MSATDDHGFAALLDGRGRVAGPDRACVWVIGADAATFLHALLTQDIAGMAVGESRATYLLEPTGKVVARADVERAADDRFRLVTDAEAAAPLAAQLERFRIRVKAEVRHDPGERAPDTAGPADAPLGDPSWYEPWRILSLLPRHGREITPDSIPNELPRLREHVSFTKGCYLGQELVERIDSRGAHTARRLCGGELVEGAGWHDSGADSPSVPPAPLAPLRLHEAASGSTGPGAAAGNSVGNAAGNVARSPAVTVTSTARHPITGRTLALAFLARRVDNGEVLVLHDDAGREWTFVPASDPPSASMPGAVAPTHAPRSDA